MNTIYVEGLFGSPENKMKAADIVEQVNSNVVPNGQPSSTFYTLALLYEHNSDYWILYLAYRSLLAFYTPLQKGFNGLMCGQKLFWVCLVGRNEKESKFILMFG